MNRNYVHADRNAADVLGRIGDPRAVEPLMLCARDTDPQVRNSIINALKNIGDSRTLPVFIEALRDGQKGIRRSAVYGLGKIGGQQAFESLSRTYKNDSDSDIRREALVAIAGLKDEATVSFLIELINNSDDNVDLEIAAKTLGEIGDTRTIEPLCSLLITGKYNDVAEATIAALRKFGPIVGEPLSKKIDELSGKGRKAAIILLTECGDIAIEPLIKILEGKSFPLGTPDSERYRLRYTAAQFLGQFSEPRVSSALAKIATDEGGDYGLRTLAMSSLDKINDLNAFEAAKIIVKQGIVLEDEPSLVHDLKIPALRILVKSDYHEGTTEVIDILEAERARILQMRGVGKLIRSLADKYSDAVIHLQEKVDKAVSKTE